MAKQSNQKRDRRYTTFRLASDDYQLMRRLGKAGSGISCRYDALCELTDIVQALKLPNKRDKHGFRAGIPRALDEALKKKAKETGYRYVDLLLIAARLYDKQVSGNGELSEPAHAE